MTNFDDDEVTGPRKFDFVFSDETVESDDSAITIRELIATLEKFPNLDAPVQVFIQRDRGGIALPTFMYTIGYDPNTGDGQIVVIPDLGSYLPPEDTGSSLFPSGN